MCANLRNFRKDRGSEQPISIASLQVNIRKFVINFVQGDVIQTLVTNLLFRDNEWSINCHAYWPFVRLCFSLTFVQHLMCPLPLLSDSFLASMGLALLSLPPFWLVFPCLDHPKSVLKWGQVPGHWTCQSFSSNSLFSEDWLILPASSVQMNPKSLSSSLIFLPNSWSYISPSLGTTSTWLHHSCPLASLFARFYLSAYLWTPDHSRVPIFPR